MDNAEFKILENQIISSFINNDYHPQDQDIVLALSSNDKCWRIYTINTDDEESYLVPLYRRKEGGIDASNFLYITNLENTFVDFSMETPI